ncbi:MAG: bifunctional adenosylcobinamide kinase/adenosylcobinamide-phosphate guanylyltransferase [Pseudomonadota bacterium]
MQHLELILGGARSGKSLLAETRAESSKQQLCYIATATAGDAEFARRIEHHRQRRDARWQVVEEPVKLAQTLADNAATEKCLLVDCLTLWLSNCLHAGVWPEEKLQLLEVLPELPGHTILVSNETGLGVVPLGELSRTFVDEAGFLHQALGQLCQQVTLTVAGLPLSLKGEA